MGLDFTNRQRSPYRSATAPLAKQHRRVGYWFFGIGLAFLILSQGQTFLQAGRAFVNRGSRSAVDTRMPLPAYREPLPHDAVRIEAHPTELAMLDSSANQDTSGDQASDKPNTTATTVEPAQATTTEPANEPMTEPRRVEKPATTKANDNSKFYDELQPELLSTIRDREPWRDTEDPALYHLFGTLQTTDLKKLAAATERIQDFRTLFEQSKYYRGKALRLVGSVIWYEPQPLAKNPLNLTQQYLVGIQLPNDDNPIFVYCLEAPVPPRAGKSDEHAPTRIMFKQGQFPVQVDGLFMKNLGYLANDAWRFAPVILARRVDVYQPQTPVPTESNSQYWLLGIAVVGALILLPMLWLWTRPRQRFTISNSTNVDEVVDLRNLSIPVISTDPDQNESPADPDIEV